MCPLKNNKNKHMKKAFSLFMFGLTSLVYAQTSDYNTQTLNLFNEGKWERLTIIGEEAIVKNKSSYEIEYRLAVAYYNLKKYFDSSKHFENITTNYNITNDYTQEYLYYSYLFSGRSQDALLISKKFPFHLQQKINAKSFEFIDYFSAEGGIKLSSRRDIDIKNMSYFNVGIGQKLGYKLMINHAFSTLSQDYIDFDYNQKEYYINANLHLSKGLTLIPAYHYINISENSVSNNTRGNNSNNEVTITEEGKINIFHLALKKQWNRFTFMPNITYSRQNDLADDINTMQYGLDLGYTLNAFNDKLWLGLGTNVLNEDNENNTILNAKAHYLISPKAFLYLKYIDANTSHFSDDNAMFYTNAVSLFNNKISTTFGYYITSKFLWYANYQFENAEDIENGFSFTYNTFITGIKFDF